MGPSRLLLLKFRLVADDGRNAIAQVISAAHASAAVRGAYRALESDEAYAYVSDPQASRASGADGTTATRATEALQARWPQATVVRLDSGLELAGASAGKPASHHYVVETDVLPDHEADFNAWYDQEHLPGLAAVPGTVRAARYVSPDGAPRHYACYDLESPQVLGSPPWLAVRETAWSARVRPTFRNTKRTMFERVA